MNEADVLQILIQTLRVNPRFFSIGNEIKDNATNVELLYDGKYAVYALERGIKNNLKIFDTKDEAYSELIRRMEFDIKNGFNLSE